MKNRAYIQLLKFGEFYKQYDNFSKKVSFKKYLRGLDFFRAVEYPLVYNAINSRVPQFKEDRIAVLDVGSRDSLFPPFFAYMWPKCNCTSIDIDQKVLDMSKCVKKLNIENYNVNIADARKLKYKNESFDMVIAVSTIEHILPKKDGDISAIKEISRVLKIGGYAIITIPYAEKFKEDWQDRNKRYLIRRYDKTTLHERLVLPSKLDISKILFFGQHRKFSKIWYNSPLCMVRFFTPFLANHFIHVSKNDVSADGCFLILKKVST